MGVALVAGGARGIGRAVVQAFCAQGDRVLLADARLEEAELTRSLCPEGQVSIFHRDLSDFEAAKETAARTIEVYGAIDTLFATAAIMPAAPLAQWTPDMWESSVALNLRMPFLMAQAAAPYLVKSSNASIIFTSSTGALRGHAGMPAYHATKTGILGLVRSLADELGPQGVRVNCVLPGWIKTPFNDPYWSYQEDAEAKERALEASIPMRRQGTPEDVAGPVIFLASPASRYVTGSSLVVDGGYSAV